MSVMTLKRREKRRASAGTRLVWLMVIAVVMAIGFVAASPAFADGDDDKADYSLYKLSSSVSSFYSNAVSPDSDQEGAAKALKGNGGRDAGAWRDTAEDGGSAGSFLGYPDADKGLSLKWLSSQFSGSSATYSFDSFKQLANGDKIPVRGLQQYSNYGAALQSLGLDSTKTELSPGWGARFGGGIMLFLYILSGGVDMAFYFVLTLLDMLNPFKLFYAGVAALSPTFAQGMVGGSGGATTGPLSGLASFLGGVYSAAQGIGIFIMIPLIIVILVLGALFLRPGEARGFAPKLGRRSFQIAFIILGVPLLGSMYSGTLSSMKEATAGANAGSSQVVLSTYTDFENWMLKSRLGVTGAQDPSCPMVIEWDQKNGKPTALSQNALRTTAICVNSLTGQYSHASAASLGVVSDSTGTSHSNSMSMLSSSISPSVNAGDPADKSDYTAVTRMLGRYISNDMINASDFEASVKGAISDSVNKGVIKSEDASKWFTDFDDPSDLEKKKSSDINWGGGSGNPIIRTQNGLTVKDKNSDTMTFISNTARRDCGGGVVSSDGKPLNCTLSPLAAYNFLNSSFSSNSVTAYSSEKAASGLSRESHAAVSQIGSGLMKVIYWGNSATLLLSYVIFGLGYAGALLVNSLRRMLQMALAIPGSGFGFMGAVSRVIVYTVALVVEIIGTIFLYSVVQMVLFSLPQILESPFSAFITNHKNLAAVLGIATAGYLPMITSVFTIVVVLGVTIMALKFRKTVISGIEEFVRNIIDRLLLTNTPAPGGGGPGLIGAAAGGVGAGAGAVMRGRGMGMGMSQAGKAGGSSARRASGLGTQPSTKPSAKKAGLLGLGAGMAAPAAIAGKSLGLPGSADDDEGTTPTGVGPDDQPQLPGGGSGGAGGSGGLGGDAQALGDQDADSAVLDENGNPVVSDGSSTLGVDPAADGSDLSTSGQFVDADGNVIDAEGNPVPASQITTDADGNPVGADGKPLPSAEFVDAEGNPVAAKDVSIDPQTGAPVDADGNELMSSAYRDADGELVPAKDVTIDPKTGAPMDARTGEALTSAAFVTEDGSPVPADQVGLSADGTPVNTETGETLVPRAGTAEGADGSAESTAPGQVHHLDVASGQGASMRERADQIRANGGLIDKTKADPQTSPQTSSISTVSVDPASDESKLSRAVSAGRSIATDAASGTGVAGAVAKTGSTVASGVNSSAQKASDGMATMLGAGALVAAAEQKRQRDAATRSGVSAHRSDRRGSSVHTEKTTGSRRSDRGLVTRSGNESRESQSRQMTAPSASTRSASQKSAPTSRGDRATRSVSAPTSIPASRVETRRADSTRRGSSDSGTRRDERRSRPQTSASAGSREAQAARTAQTEAERRARTERRSADATRKRAQEQSRKAKREAQRTTRTARTQSEQARREVLRARQEVNTRRRRKR